MLKQRRHSMLHYFQIKLARLHNVLFSVFWFYRLFGINKLCPLLIKFSPTFQNDCLIEVSLLLFGETEVFFFLSKQTPAPFLLPLFHQPYNLNSISPKFLLYFHQNSKRPYFCLLTPLQQPLCIKIFLAYTVPPTLLNSPRC